MKFAVCLLLLPSLAVAASIGLSQGVPCTEHESAVEWYVDDSWRYVKSNSIPAATVFDYCPFGIGGLYCGEYKSCPSGEWGESGELCVPQGSGIVLDPNRTGADWGDMPTVTDDCPSGSWLSKSCPQNAVETQGDCLQPRTINYRMPLQPLPVAQSVGPAKCECKASDPTTPLVPLQFVEIIRHFSRSNTLRS